MEVIYLHSDCLILSAPGSRFNYPLVDKATGALSNTAHLAEREMLLKSCKAGRLYEMLRGALGFHL